MPPGAKKPTRAFANDENARNNKMAHATLFPAPWSIHRTGRILGVAVV
jgi:hypothetical protein